MVQTQLSTESFSKSSNSQDHLFGYDVIHTPAQCSCLGVYYDNSRERKTVPNDYASEFLTRIVQSPTKLNDKIKVTKND